MKTLHILDLPVFITEKLTNVELYRLKTDGGSAIVEKETEKAVLLKAECGITVWCPKGVFEKYAKDVKKHVVNDKVARFKEYLEKLAEENNINVPIKNPQYNLLVIGKLKKMNVPFLSYKDFE